jgi:hypothetical protein
MDQALMTGKLSAGNLAPQPHERGDEDAEGF